MCKARVIPERRAASARDSCSCVTGRFVFPERSAAISSHRAKRFSTVARPVAKVVSAICAINEWTWPSKPACLAFFFSWYTMPSDDHSYQVNLRLPNISIALPAVVG
jgi:hypothetical protein